MDEAVADETLSYPTEAEALASLRHYAANAPTVRTVIRAALCALTYGWIGVGGVIAADLQVASLSPLPVGVVGAGIDYGGKFQGKRLLPSEYIVPANDQIEDHLVGVSENGIPSCNVFLIVAGEIKIPECNLPLNRSARDNWLYAGLSSSGFQPRIHAWVPRHSTNFVQGRGPGHADAAGRGLPSILQLENYGDGVTRPTVSRGTAVEIRSDLRFANTLGLLSLIERSGDEVETYGTEQGLKAADDIHPEGSLTHAHLSVQVIVGALLIALGGKGVMDADLALKRGEAGARGKGKLSVFLFALGCLVAVLLPLKLSLELQTPT